MSKNNIDNLRKAIKNEGLIICASKNHGKTNALACIVSTMKNSIPIVVDYATQRVYTLGSDFQVKFLSERYLLKKPRIRINKPIIRHELNFKRCCWRNPKRHNQTTLLQKS